MESSSAKVIPIGTYEKIQSLPSNVQGVARMIEEEGNRLVAAGRKPDNVNALVIAQLLRLIDGSIGKCINPECAHNLTLIDLHEDPLRMACCEQCAEEAVAISTTTNIEELKTEISDLEVRMRIELRDSSEMDNRSGDIIDMVKAPVGQISTQILSQKKLRLERLRNVAAAIKKGTLSLDCAAADCDESIPISVRVASPEFGFCVACMRKRKIAK